MGYAHHLAHAFYRLTCDSVVELSLITHYRVDEYHRARGSLLAAVVGYHARLTLRCHEARRYGVEGEPQLAPHGKDTFYIVGCLKNVELAVVERVRHKCRRQIVSGMTHVREYRQHRGGSHLAISGNVVYKQYLFLFHLIRVSPANLHKIVGISEFFHYSLAREHMSRTAHGYDPCPEGHPAASEHTRRKRIIIHNNSKKY